MSMNLTITDLVINELRLLHWVNDANQIVIHSKKLNGENLKFCYSIESIGIVKKYTNWKIGDWLKVIDIID